MILGFQTIPITSCFIGGISFSFSPLILGDEADSKAKARLCPVLASFYFPRVFTKLIRCRSPSLFQEKHASEFEVAGGVESLNRLKDDGSRRRKFHAINCGLDLRTESIGLERRWHRGWRIALDTSFIPRSAILICSLNSSSSSFFYE